jgi:lipopolysaccharide biosynthesis glycosyltransferase
MSRHAVCYVASDRYLFQTVLSALQARANVSDEADVIVVGVGATLEPSAETAAFARVCAENGILFRAATTDQLEGQHPMWGRLFLDRLLPPDVDEILYLDGDTQIVGNIDPLVFAEPPARGAIGVRDPIVFIRESVPAFRKEIDDGWNRADVPAHVRARYLNSGMLRMSRETFGEVREAALAIQREKGASLRFADQDAINLALDDRVDTVSMEWNFPGFLLGSNISELVDFRIIHFMSDPRPWDAALWPWGRRFFSPYGELVQRYPEVRPFWSRPTISQRLRYSAQQAWKRANERTRWNSSASADEVKKLTVSERVLS